MSDRLGVFPPGSITDDCTNFSGEIRVPKEKCATCPFRPTSNFAPQLKRIATHIKANPTQIMQCHNTFPSDVLASACRGSYDYFPTPEMQAGNVEFVENAQSKFHVMAWNE